MSALHTLEQAHRTLDNLRRSQLRIDLIAGLIRIIALTVLIWLIGIAVEAGFGLSTSIRYLLLSGCAAISISLILFIYVKIKRNPRFKPGRYADEWWALQLGKSAPDKLRDRLLNAIQINQPLLKYRGLESEDLAKQALYSAVADLEDITLANALDSSPRRKSLRILAYSGLTACLLFIILPVTLFQATSRLFHPHTTYTVPPPFSLSIDPAGGWAYRGESVTFTVIAEGSPPDRAEFVYRFKVGGRQQSDYVTLENGQGKIEFSGFPDPIHYFARSGTVVSSEYNLDIISRPQVAELQYRLFSPKYSRLPMVLSGDNIGDVEALPGSRLEMTIRSSKQLAQSWLSFLRSGADSSSIDSIALSASGQTCTGNFTIMREGSYRIHLRDSDGHENRDPINYHVRLIADNHPLVRIAYPTEDVVLGDDVRLPLLVEADDDYGISRIDLAYSVMGQDSVVKTVPLDFSPHNTQAVTADYIWDLSEMPLFPGDVLEYWAIAWDNDRVSGPKRSESERRLVRLPSIEEIVADIEQSEEAGIEQAERTLEDARELKEKIAEIVEELRRNPDLDWEKQREMEEALQHQAELERQIEELSQRIDELIDKLEKHDLTTIETLEKYQELQNLIAEIATPELMQAMEKLREAMASQDPDKVRQALEEFDIGSEEFLERIERTMNILKQLQLERKMDELVRLTEELLHRQEEILNKADSQSSEELAERQQALSNTMDILSKNMQETMKLAEQTGEVLLASKLDSLSKLSAEKDIGGRMENAAEAFSENRMRDACEAGEQAARDLAELSAGLKQSAAELKEERKEQLARNLRRLTEELIIISRSQEDLTSQSSRIETKSPRYRDLAGSQGDIRMALQGVIARLFELSRETFFITPDLGASLGKAVEELDRALAGFSDRNPRSVAPPQQKALGEINRSALKILNILGELEGAASSTGYEEMMDRLSQMAQSQQGLNEQTMMLPGGQGEQMIPGGEQFSRMAAQQRALQQQMQKLSEEGQGMREILGDLDGITKSMGEVADDIEDQNINERTRRLQRQIVSRLLDATRSVKEREYSKRRESKTGRELVRKSPPSLLFDQDRDKLRRDLLRALQEGYTRDYRQLIRNYFQTLEKLEKE